MQVGENFERIIEDFRGELAAIRTGRASASLVEDLEVAAYETKMPLKELAAIAVPEARQILITPWDKSVLEAVEAALRAAGLNPVVEGAALRINLPPLTGEDRERLVKEVGKKAEDARVRVRQVRRRMIDEIERLEREKQLSEDEAFARKKVVDEEVKEINKRIAELAEEKKQSNSWSCE